MRYIPFLIFYFHALTAGPLMIGMELTYPPFETVDEKGAPTGISVDFAKELGRALKRETLIKNIPFVGLIPALKSGQIDLIISSMSITEQRLKSIDFSIPYATPALALLVSQSSPLQNVRELNQKGRVAVVKLGTTAQFFAAKYLKNAKVILLDKESSAVMEVVQGKADAFIYDQLSIYNNWKKNERATRALLTPIQKEYWAVGIRKGNYGLQNEVNAFIKEFREKGGFEKITDRYLPEQKKYFAEHHIPFYF